MNTPKPSILLVEDDPNLSLVLQDYLEMMNFDIHLCRNGKEGLDAFRHRKFNICILDIMMPVMDGFTLAEEIRKTDDTVPIVFLTAKSLKEDRIKGFRMGCDDYITKPFSTEELSLRIQAILKRCMNQPARAEKEEPPVYNLGNYIFDHKNLILSINGEQKVLTRKENALLKLLFEHQNQLLPREVALKSVWGNDDYFIGRSMDVFITKLRKYLKDDPSIFITNVHGTGFKLEVKK
ncbi:MAG TPA: response regulator transcription factor [Bacteroidales bacterium]|jgi:DNA-binding response OmpR family regulator|nr:response regulator transcription factor [Bacteroidales bacterium]HNQ82499.1 response regulator transcription factor [Bacteroidales bacterium]